MSNKFPFQADLGLEVIKVRHKNLIATEDQINRLKYRDTVGKTMKCRILRPPQEKVIESDLLRTREGGDYPSSDRQRCVSLSGMFLRRDAADGLRALIVSCVQTRGQPCVDKYIDPVFKHRYWKDQKSLNWTCKQIYFILRVSSRSVDSIGSLCIFAFQAISSLSYRRGSQYFAMCSLIGSPPTVTQLGQ